MARPPGSSDHPRRFYKEAAAAPADGGFAVQLDGRTPRSPLRKPLVLPTLALAELIAWEWAGQGDEIDFNAMPTTRLAFTTIDRLAAARTEVAAEIARFAGADLLCYFADGPDTLTDRQVRHWGPVIEWAQSALGVAFNRTQGIVHRPQPPQTLARIEALAAGEDDFVLAGLAFAAALFGSAILAFALRHGELTAEAAYDLSRLDETYQAEKWGLDAEAEARAEAMARDAVMVGAWFEALA